MHFSWDLAWTFEYLLKCQVWRNVAEMGYYLIILLTPRPSQPVKGLSLSHYSLSSFTISRRRSPTALADCLPSRPSQPFSHLSLGLPRGFFPPGRPYNAIFRPLIFFIWCICPQLSQSISFFTQYQISPKQFSHFLVRPDPEVLLCSRRSK